MTRARDLGDFIADGAAAELVVDTTTLVVDSTNNRVGIGTASPSAALDVTGDVSIADKIIHTGDTNTAIRFPAADTVTVETGGTERMRIDSSGNVIIGETSPINGGNLNVATSAADATISALCRSTTDSHGVTVVLQKSSTNSGNFAATADGENLGKILFRGVNTSTVSKVGAQISVVQNGTDSSTVPADMVFTTKEAERFRMGSLGQLGIGGATYGTSGQVLTSGGSGAAPTWADAGGGAYELITNGRTTVSSNASAITYTGVSTSVGVIKLIINNLKVTTQGIDLNLNLIDGSNNILSATNSYRQTVMYHGASGADGDTTSYSTKISLNLKESVNSDAYAVSGYTAVLYFFGFGSAYTKMFGEAWYNYDDHSSYWMKESIGAIYMKNTTTAAGLIIQPSSGSISSGNVSLLKLT